jgi:hypothetical protein
VDYIETRYVLVNELVCFEKDDLFGGDIAGEGAVNLVEKRDRAEIKGFRRSGPPL